MQVRGDILADSITLTANCRESDSTKECVFVTTSKCASQIHISCQFPGFLGCFNHQNSSSALFKVLSSFTEFTIQKCIEECREEGYDFAGVTQGATCLCGDTIASRQLDNYLCQAFPCRDDTYQSCGGGSEISIYGTSFGKCGGHIGYPSNRGNTLQYLVSPNYPESSEEVDCRWTILFQKRTAEVQVIFIDLLLRQASFLKFSYLLSNGYVGEQYLMNTDDRPVEFVQNFEEVPIVSMTVQLSSPSNESLACFAMYYKANLLATIKMPSASSEQLNTSSYITSSITSVKVSATEEMPPTKLNLNFVYGWLILGLFVITTWASISLKIPCKTHKREDGESSHSVRNHARRSKQVSLSSIIDDDVNSVHLNRIVSDDTSVSHGNIVELAPEQQKGHYYIENESGKKIICKSQEPTEVTTDDKRED
ncbi:Kremen protein 1 [Holothuria leucospilota]|uniref:Kremen protein 1 n=1 Tax=Holothuria leucospilota TaxID=206669 RepID=A0A9Q1BUB7_HOLLE|nr:Kremen protein 1 [Holothuria leucospilota]